MTSHSVSLLLPPPRIHSPRTPLRLRMSTAPGEALLDGGWWPQSRDLDLELADLVDHLPVLAGRVQRALYSPADWETGPDSVGVAGCRLPTRPGLPEEPHLLELHMSTRTDLRLLVVPPDHAVGEQAMAIAADPSNRWSTTQILAAGAFDPEVSEDHDHWHDDGDSWWLRPEIGPPSFR